MRMQAHFSCELPQLHGCIRDCVSTSKHLIYATEAFLDNYQSCTSIVFFITKLVCIYIWTLKNIHDHGDMEQLSKSSIGIIVQWYNSSNASHHEIEVVLDIGIELV